MSEKIQRTDEEWRKLLSSEEYEILRRKGTERAFTGKYWKTKEAGTYVCAACGNALFSADTKYESGSGWPSFYAPLKGDAVETETDYSHGMVRTEAMCARCGSHLGHVFEDGPAPTGLRFCMNSASLKLETEKG
jgi:peptide-methionine (R)-S-oxide reductase